MTKPTMISLDPPYRIPAEVTQVRFNGWAEADDPGRPRVRLTLNGLPVPVAASPHPQASAKLGLDIVSVRADVDLLALLRDAPASATREPFLLLAEVKSDDRVRTFEYEVTDAWLQRILGRPLRARRIPPEPLQIRVTGAAAGGYHLAGLATARQIAERLESAGRPLRGFQRILDFGCGPGRVVDCIRELHPGAALHGCDIDAEAIAWAADALGDVAEFRVNGTSPPLPYPDDAFDLIYGISVFTHLPADLQDAWLFELRRVLSPGGVLLTTKLNAAAYGEIPAEVRAQFDREGFVFWGEAAPTEGLPDFYRLAYHTDAYVRRHWGQYFEVLHVGAHDINDTQDCVVLRRPRHALSWLPPGVRRGLHRLKAIRPA